jgi:hypothetical protein
LQVHTQSRQLLDQYTRPHFKLAPKYKEPPQTKSGLRESKKVAMTDFLNKTWTIDAEERLDEEMLDDECCSSSVHVQQQTFLVDSQNEADDDKNTTRTIMDTKDSQQPSHNYNSFVKCMSDMDDLFNKLSKFSDDYFLFHEDLSGFWIE